MRIAADTNILVRAIMADDPAQAALAQAELAAAERVAVTLPTLCELAWVLARGYRVPRAEIAVTLRRLIGSATVATDRPAAEAGLRLLEAGGDFADGVIAFEGRRLGAETFVTFDTAAAALLGAQGVAARVPG
jgi:predicted nucleic-acid-binding protein